MIGITLKGLLAIPAAAVWLLAQNASGAGDWPDWRGPNHDGTSAEKALPEKWSLNGENLAWKAPYGGCSTPVILGDRLYLENTAGARETEQERLLCFNANSGKLLWEYRFNLYKYRFNLYQSDVPAHRVAWASPVADPETGNVYSFGVNNLVTALTRDGKKIWERSITEEFSPFTTHGGRTFSPFIYGSLVIVSTPTSTWGTQAQRAQRFIAMDKRTGDIVWISMPGGRPYDTSYGPMNVVTVNGMRLLITSGADGAALAMKPLTGEPVWSLVVAKHGMNTGLVVNGKYAILSHGDENLEGNEMGMLAAFDATRTGKLGMDSITWMVKVSWVASPRPSWMAIASTRSTTVGPFSPSMSRPDTSCGSTTPAGKSQDSDQFGFAAARTAARTWSALLASKVIWINDSNVSTPETVSISGSDSSSGKFLPSRRRRNLRASSAFPSAFPSATPSSRTSCTILEASRMALTSPIFPPNISSSEFLS